MGAASQVAKWHFEPVPGRMNSFAEKPDPQLLAQTTLGHLQAVEQERQVRRAQPALQLRVDAVKSYQRQRFMASYADLLENPRYQAAVGFFLDELYGPQDYSQRDAQFARVVPALVRLFPHDVLQTVCTLGELHALSERLDTRMAEQLPALEAGARLTPADYAKAWRATGSPALREQQIALTLSLGCALDRYTAKSLMRHALRMMRRPAAAAGLSQLQHFLETGFDTFKAMRGSREFMAIIGERERRFAAELFGAAGS